MSIGAYDIRVVNDMVERESAFVDRLMTEVHKVVVGQDEMIERVFMGLLCGGHVLLEGAPGLAKTLTVSTLARCAEAGLQARAVHAGPAAVGRDRHGDLQPSDGHVHQPRGPVFTNLLLADEINRAPAKVQSALLESMAERQVTIGDSSYPLPRPFLVLATQNPIEQEGTYTPARGPARPLHVQDQGRLPDRRAGADDHAAHRRRAARVAHPTCRR
jgi:MoxR-like ATPase